MVAVTYGVTRVPAAKAAERVLATPRKSFFVRFMDALVESRLQAVHRADELAVLVTGEEELVHLVDERRVVDGQDLPQHQSSSVASSSVAPAARPASAMRSRRNGSGARGC